MINEIVLLAEAEQLFKANQSITKEQFETLVNKQQQVLIKRPTAIDMETYELGKSLSVLVDTIDKRVQNQIESLQKSYDEKLDKLQNKTKSIEMTINSNFNER